MRETVFRLDHHDTTGGVNLWLSIFVQNPSREILAGLRKIVAALG